MKIKFYLTLLCAIAISLNLRAQCGSVTLSSQADVDSFPTVYGCNTLSGMLRISGADITNLNGLSGLTSVGMLFIMGNDNLTDLHGLEDLTTIGSSGGCSCPYNGLTINENQKLQNINALSSLTSIGGMIRIGANPALRNIDGLSSVTSVGANADRYGANSIEISANNMLIGIDGLRHITNNTGGVFIVGNRELRDLDGLEGLTAINGGGLTVVTNQSVRNIDGLSNVQSIRDRLLISDNYTLPNLDGLRSFHQMSASQGQIIIEISHNANLANVDSLSHFDTIVNSTARSLGVIDNPNLVKGCGLYPVIKNYDFSHSFSGNTQGVTYEEIYIGGPCPPNTDTCYGQITLSTQAQIDAFPAERGCRVVRGSMIISGPDITNLDGLSGITSIGYNLQILDNPLLTNINGLGLLQEIRAYGLGSAVLTISNNPSLTNVDSLSSLTLLYGSSRRLEILNNPNLTKGCGLYPLVNAQFSCGNSCGGAVQQDYTGSPISWQQILAGGPCEGEEPGDPTAPNNLMFADVTDNSMTVSFNAGTGANGYLTVMRAFGSSLPDEAPQDGEEYNVGNVIGCCSIVVGRGMDTTLYIVYQEPDVDYYFDIIPYTTSTGYNYFPGKALSGYQRTLPKPQPYPNPFVEAITIPFTVNDDANVRIMISDQLGRPISEVVNNTFVRGKHLVTWNRLDAAGNLAVDGVYMYSIAIEGNEPVKGLVMAK